jgi:hypothetical protein
MRLISRVVCSAPFVVALACAGCGAHPPASDTGVAGNEESRSAAAAPDPGTDGAPLLATAPALDIPGAKAGAAAPSPDTSESTLGLDDRGARENPSTDTAIAR